MNLPHHSRVCLSCYDGTVHSQNLLLSLNMIQDKHTDQTVPFKALVQHMKYSYKLIGDVESQVQCALNAACDLNYVARTRRGYKLLPPEARFHARFNTCVIQAPCPKKRTQNPLCDDDSSSDDSDDDDCCGRSRKQAKRDCDGFLSRSWPTCRKKSKIRHNCPNGSSSTEELKADILSCW